MKKLFIVIFIALDLILTSCESRITDNAVSNTVSDEASEHASFEQGFPVPGFTEKTESEFLSDFDPAIYFNDDMMERALETPYGIYLKTSDSLTLMSYDKITGAFSNACRDTLCDHEECLWGSTGKFVYCGKTRMYFAFYGREYLGGKNTLYSSDFFGNDVQTLYETTDTISHIVEENGYLYFILTGIDDEDYQLCKLVRLDLETGKTKVLIQSKMLSDFMPINGKILYYSEVDGDDGMERNFYLYDPETETKEKYGDGDFLPKALYGESLYYVQNGNLYRKLRYGEGLEQLLEEDWCGAELYFRNGSIYYSDSENRVYKMSLDFEKLDVIHFSEAVNRINNVIADANLLFYTYSSGVGSSKSIFYVFVNLENGKVFEVER